MEGGEDGGCRGGSGVDGVVHESSGEQWGAGTAGFEASELTEITIAPPQPFVRLPSDPTPAAALCVFDLSPGEG